MEWKEEKEGKVLLVEKILKSKKYKEIKKNSLKGEQQKKKEENQLLRMKINIKFGKKSVGVEEKIIINCYLLKERRRRKEKDESINCWDCKFWLRNQ